VNRDNHIVLASGRKLAFAEFGSPEGRPGMSAGKLVTYPNDAHLSTLCNHMPEIAEALR